MHVVCITSATHPGGEGVLDLEKGTNCSPTAAERWWWLSQPEMAKKRGPVLLLYCKIRELSESLHPIFYII